MTTTQALLDSLLAHKASINLATTEQKKPSPISNGRPVACSN